MGAREIGNGGQGFNANDALQFYETPDDIADRLVGMVEDRGQNEAVLDAAAGRGALSAAWRRASGAMSVHGRDLPSIHAVEIDASHHGQLKEHAKVVGLDFMSFQGIWTYAVVLMNPPFAKGAAFVLRAWDGLWAGKVAAIINAETLRNPYTQDRQRLVALIEKHGRVEFVRDAFQGDGVDREADVEVALIYLKKPASSGADWVGSTIQAMERDASDGVEESRIYRLPSELTLPRNFVENQVLAFNAAVDAMRASVRAEMVASHFASRIGMTMAELQRKSKDATANYSGLSEAETRKVLRTRYIELKDRAWASVLRSTDMLKKMTRKVQRSAEAEFETIKQMEFSASTIYGFLLGLVQSAGEMQTQAILDLFDSIIGYSHENVEVYRAYKSNTKHRLGMRIKHTRFILSRMDGSYSRQPSWETQQRLADIDRVMCMLDGVAEVENGLLATCMARWSDLYSGERVDSAHFSIRAYKGAETVHIYPKRVDLLACLNRRVGEHRKWIPEPHEQGTDAFMKAYGKTDKLSKEVLAEAAKNWRATSSYWRRRSPLEMARLNTDNEDCLDSDVRNARDALSAAMDGVLRKHNLLDAIEQEEKAAQIAQGEPDSGGSQLLLLSMD